MQRRHKVVHGEQNQTGNENVSLDSSSALRNANTVCNVILKARVGRSELKASQIVGRDYT